MADRPRRPTPQFSNKQVMDRLAALPLSRPEIKPLKVASVSELQATLSAVHPVTPMRPERLAAIKRHFDLGQ